jgi:glutathione S-transferase
MIPLRDMREAAMYRLYWSRDTGAFAPDVVMHLAGVPCERILVDRSAGEHRQPDYLRLNPMGEVPTLVLPDGTVLTESAAMLLHLVDAFPQAGLAPPPGTADRARFDRWLLFTAVNLYGAVLRQAYPERYTTDPAAAPGVREAADRAADRYWALIADALDPGPFLLGDRRSAADLYLLLLLTWYDFRDEMTPLSTLWTRLLADPGVAEIWARYFG